MKIVSFFYLFVGLFIMKFSLSQDIDTLYLQAKETEIQILFNEFKNQKSDEEKIKINDQICGELKSLFIHPISFDYSFDSLKNVGKITSEDNKVRIFTWNIPLIDGTHLYSGYIMYKYGNGKKIKLFRLEDKSDQIENIELSSLTCSNWLGALYYSIIQKKDKGQVYYTLLAFDFNDIFSAKKIIDVLWFDEKDEPVFGKPIFKYREQPTSRIVFEFSSRVSMTLKYVDEKEMIIFDHLSPSRLIYQGRYQFYGPDFSYDGLLFEKGYWTLVKDIDIRNAFY